MASSSSSSMQQKHQVFLSFRGEDTRNNFTSHLHAALKRKGIAYFIDYQLIRGAEISPALLTAIDESMISIIVLSKNYGSSSWCLDELSKILECKEGNGQMVVPIFYHVDPSDVRKQTGSFAEAFAEHVKKRADKVEKWRAALKELANLSGWHLQGQPNDKPESQLIVEIVEDVAMKLMNTSLYDTKGLIGIDSRIDKIKKLLCFSSKDVRILGIWGMGGIGKTTIAEVVFHQIFTKFEGCCFLPNVKENYGRGHLQEELFSKILEDSNLNASTSSLPTSTKDRLRHKKVLIVLDDVDNPKQLDLLPEKHCFGLGSRIIVTSRDKQVLRQVVDVMYEVEGLFDDEALQLFSLYAFKQSHPKEDFMELSMEVVYYAKGVPLALKVLGSHLYDRSILFWENELKKLKEILHPEIDNILRISIDGLDHEVKNILLDIACFFKENDRDYVKNILDSCYISVMSGISVLIDKSLITISCNLLKMHDLVQQMSWNIVHEEAKEPGKRSRLWTPNDIYHVLKYNTGTEMVEGMLLDMSKIRKICLSSTVFERMYNLKLLKFYYDGFKRESERKVCLSPQGLKFLPDNLRLLHWDDYPSKSLPQNFCPENLVELRMPDSHIERLWNGVQDLVNLKKLDLSSSVHLIEIPDLSRATALESIILNKCTSLVEVPSSIGCLSKLKYLDMEGCRRIEELPSSIEHLVGLGNLKLDNCEKLKNLPSGISKLKSLETLSLYDCSNITKFPETPGNLRMLELSGTAIEQVPSSIECLSQLKELYLVNCTKLSSLTRNIFQLKSLIMVRVSGFSKLEVIEERLGTVQVLIANGTAEISINKGFKKELDVSGCSGLDELLDDFKNFKIYCLEDCNLFAFPRCLTRIFSITELTLSGNSFETIPASIGQLLKLETLRLSHCKRLQLLPASIRQLLKLKTLNISYCERLQFLPELPPYLEYLDARDCISLKAVSSSFTNCPMPNGSWTVGERFIFLNCISLDQNTIWAKTQLGIQQVATGDAKLYHKNQAKCFCGTTFFICLPGSEIPEWFSYQNEGSSVTIQLPPHLHEHKFVGFAMCYVLAYNRDFNLFHPSFGVKCQYKFKTNGDAFLQKSFSCGLWGGLNDFRFIDSDHVCVKYDFQFYSNCFEGPPSNFEQIGHHLNEVSFEFSLCDYERNDLLGFVVVKKCGVRLLYAEDDLMEFPHGLSEECNPLMIQPSSLFDPMVKNGSTTKRPRDDYCYDKAKPSANFNSDEEEDPFPKRSKYMEIF